MWWTIAYFIHIQEIIDRRRLQLFGYVVRLESNILAHWALRQAISVRGNIRPDSRWRRPRGSTTLETALHSASERNGTGLPIMVTGSRRDGPLLSTWSDDDDDDDSIFLLRFATIICSLTRQERWRDIGHKRKPAKLTMMNWSSTYWTFILREWICMMRARASSFGVGNSILRSSRPERSSAGSRMSTRLVAAITYHTYH